jgi:group II intron reverse transcriptase/maturase
MVSTKLTTKLEGFRRRNAENSNYVNKDIYRMLYTREIYYIAYNNIKSNDGAETTGSDGTSLHGFSEAWIDEFIASMRDESYLPKPSRTTHIPKQDGSGRMRKLSFPNGKDKIIQESVRLILDCIYEPTFSNLSHGYRPNRSTHSAMAQISTWTATSWLIEGDISACFDEVDHRILESILRERISDERFIRLINKLLRAGYLDTDLSSNGNKFGVGQGSICSPILANVYLDKLDRFMEDLIIRENKGINRKKNNEYERLRRQLRKAELNEDIETIEINTKEMRGMTSVDPMDKNYVRVRYVRYADDFLVGVIGSKELAKKIKQEIQEFLKTILKLRLNDEKTKITNAKNNEVKFLGFCIAKHQANLICLMDTKKLIRKLHQNGMCDASGFPIAMTKAQNKPVQDIIRYANQVLHGLLNGHLGCSNFNRGWRIQYIVQFSTAKTIARKFDISMKAVFKKYGKSLKSNYLNSKGEIKEISLSLRRSFKRNKDFRINWLRRLKEHVIVKYDSRNPLAKKCYVCDESQNRKMFHRRRKGLIKTPYPHIIKEMLRINRRQICLCGACFTQVTNNELEYNQISTFFK